MKLRLAPPGLAGRFHGPLRFGRAFRGHELALRILQLALLFGVAWGGAQLIAASFAWITRTIAGLVG